MERRQALRLTLVIASIATAFMPWVMISFFDLRFSMSLLDMMTDPDGMGAFQPWIISGIVYLIGSALLLVRDEAPYIQLIGLFTLPIMVLSDMSGFDLIDGFRLLWGITGYGLYLAQATTVIGTLVFARPRRLLTLIERYLPMRSWPHAARTLRARGEEIGDTLARSNDGRRTTIRPVVREAVISAPKHDMAMRPRTITTTTDAWWSDDIDASPREATEVPCIRLPPPRTRGASSMVRQDGGRRDR